MAPSSVILISDTIPCETEASDQTLDDCDFDWIRFLRYYLFTFEAGGSQLLLTHDLFPSSPNVCNPNIFAFAFKTIVLTHQMSVGSIHMLVNAIVLYCALI